MGEKQAGEQCSPLQWMNVEIIFNGGKYIFNGGTDFVGATIGRPFQCDWQKFPVCLSNKIGEKETDSHIASLLGA